MADGARQGRSAVCFGDPDAFASEMIQMINQKEYRFVLMKRSFTCIVFFFSDVRFAVGEEKQVIYGHRCVLAAR